jgi:hypothetical protein
MPRDRLYVARWHDEVLEGYPAGIKRIGRSHDRELVLPPELKKTSWELYVAAIGDPPKRLGTTADPGPFRYEPWRTAQYWVMACKPEYCFVIFTTRHKV